ncbi:MAG: hypothetical protein J6D27_03560 [Ruminiclostridium sp.]|nr:hypothetical protein [Ruminiclostridium sp.]
MAEVTRIITAEITVIGDVEEHQLLTDEQKQEMAIELKEALDVDGVVITKVQDFVRE